jgi:hypothetical protein
LSLTLTGAVEALLKGATLEWPQFKDHKAGAISLPSPAARRLFRFLLAQPARKLLAPDETIFAGLLKAWHQGDDPAEPTESAKPIAQTQGWRLARLEASAFGGLTIFGGPIFDLVVDGENWCLEGQNGSGKTSLTNAVLWAMTGRRVSEQEGLIEDRGERLPVYNDDGLVIGDWPPLVSYPERASDLAKTAEAWVRLTFKNRAAETATAFRKVTSPKGGEPSFASVLDPRLTTAPQLIETGLLMPARVPRVGFGARSQPLYEAVKLLTGLDLLAGIAEAARLLTHHGQAFLKFAKQQGIDQLAGTFYSNLAKADAKAAVLDIDLSACRTLGDTETSVTLTRIAREAGALAGEHLATLKTVIATGLDTKDAKARVRIRSAVVEARVVVNQGAKGITEFEGWTALKQAKDDPSFGNANKAISEGRTEIGAALLWHARQKSDQKLRLKALAAKYYLTPHGKDEVGLCPLCQSRLSSATQKALAIELAELQEHADLAERKISDVCSAVKQRLDAALTSELRMHREGLLRRVPKEAYRMAALGRFAEEEPFKSTLVGIAKSCRETVDRQAAALPEFTFPELVKQKDLPDPAIEAHRAVHELAHLVALVDWWSDNGTAFREAWVALVQAKDDTGSFRAHTIAGQVSSLEQAIERAEPLDEVAAHLAEASKAAESWKTLDDQQSVREAISEALLPLKEFRFLVDAETASSIATLSKRIKAILDQLHLRERFQYENTALEKKAVTVEGSFDTGMRIDAGTVANASWLRAILWAFILALREETIEALGTNPFPLMVMDDPQTTFDPRNKRKWAEVLVKAANTPIAEKGGMQLILTTHEQQFFKFLVDEQRLSGQQGLVAPLNKATRVATIVNGSTLGREYGAAIAANDDSLAHKFISDVRIYCEDLLKCMMRAEGPGVANMNLDSLKKELKRLRDSSVPPFNRSVFGELSEMLMGGGGGPMKLVNDSHHQYDGTIGVAQAIDVHTFWSAKLRTQLHKAFHVHETFTAYTGDPRVFAWEDTVAEFPPSQVAAVKALSLLDTGVAAAARTDGRVGDGVLSITEWDASKPIRLHNHEIYQLAASTLDPIASIGDFLIVSNYAPVTRHSLIVTAFGNRLLARRYNESDTHPDVAVLTGQTLEPHELPSPIIAPKEKLHSRKIVGTIFAAHIAVQPRRQLDCEFSEVPDFTVLHSLLKGARLFRVEGRSAEPIALEGQFLITRPPQPAADTVHQLDQRLVVAVDSTGARYFKRLHVRPPLVILESLNPDGTTAAELLSLDPAQPFAQLSELLEVVGILFELPEAKKKS